VRLSNSQDVSFIQRVLIPLVLRLIMNDGFSCDLSIACSEFFRVSWVNRWRSPSEAPRIVTTILAHGHKQSKFTDGAYLVAAGHLIGCLKQDIVLLQIFIVGVNHPFIATPQPATPTLLQYFCTPVAQYTPRHRSSLCMTLHHTILMMAISCKGQLIGRTVSRSSDSGLG